MARGPGAVGLEEKIASLPDGPWYRRAEISRLLGVTPSAVWAAAQSETNEELYPTGVIDWSGRQVHLWTREQLGALRAHFRRNDSLTGRPRIWTLAESRTRQKKFGLARYYDTRAGRLEESGEPAAAGAARRHAAKLREDLGAQLDKRLAERAEQEPEDERVAAT